VSTVIPTASGVEAVVAAYRLLVDGDVEPVVRLLAPEAEWWSQGVRLHRGSDDAAGAFRRLGPGIELTGLRKGGRVVVFEFSRPWWKRRRTLYAVSASAGFRAEQVVWVEGGLIRKIETREHVLPDAAA